VKCVCAGVASQSHECGGGGRGCGGAGNGERNEVRYEPEKFRTVPARDAIVVGVDVGHAAAARLDHVRVGREQVYIYSCTDHVRHNSHRC